VLISALIKSKELVRLKNAIRSISRASLRSETVLQRQIQNIYGLHLLFGTYDPSSALAVSTESADLQLSCLRSFARLVNI